ncbi:hypothetical protein [Nostoc sp. 'Peltigera malacea cyanobiont' DB3992]|nr:hypothetical protein [Nostoc sp. 'Peltigera malacea cyanobiont' DB3992]
MGAFLPSSAVLATFAPGNAAIAFPAFPPGKSAAPLATSAPLL